MKSHRCGRTKREALACALGRVAAARRCSLSRHLPEEQLMTTTPMAAPTFSDEELARVLAAMKGSDSVELKLSVAEPQQRSTLLSLGMDPLDAQIRVVAFFDTPDLALDRHGLVVRARRIQGKGDD